MTRAADDAEAIAKRLAELRREREQARAEAEALRQPEEQAPLTQYFDGGCG